jgi:hypothetical protein
VAADLAPLTSEPGYIRLSDGAGAAAAGGTISLGPPGPVVAGPERPSRAARAPVRSATARLWLAGTVSLTVGAAAAAVLLAPSGSAPPGEGLAFLLFLGSSVHVASTGWFYTVPPVRAHMKGHRVRYLWAPLALITGAGAVAMAVPTAVLYWLLLPYFGWQFHHFQKQNLGIAALAASSGRLAPLTRPERRALIAAGLATVAGLVTRPARLQVPLPQLHGPALAGPPLAFAACVACGMVALARRPRAQRPAAFCLVYLTALVFGLPAFVFSSPYAAVAGLTVAHGLQYLLLMGLVTAGPVGGSARSVQLAMLGSIALLGGSALSLASDGLTGDAVAHALFGIFLGAVMAHFVIDAGLWRMRDEFPRAFLGGRLPYLVPARAAP